VFGSVVLACLFGVVRGVVEVAFCDMRMMAGLFVIAGLMVFGSCSVMFSGVFVVLRSFAVVLRGVFGHLKSPVDVSGSRVSLATRG
jgi:hypothetical protein